MPLSQDLTDVAEKLESLANDEEAKLMVARIAKLKDSAEFIGKSWSGSWLGYHANVYYSDFISPPAGAHFSVEWGLKSSAGMGTRGNWVEYDPDFVIERIYKDAGRPDIFELKELIGQYAEDVASLKSEVLSIFQAYDSGKSDKFVAGLVEMVDKIQLYTASKTVRALRPTGRIMTRDSCALGSGYKTPPHIKVIGDIFEITNPQRVAGELARIARRAASHLKRIESTKAASNRIGTNVFIGHGRSRLWKDLKDFIQDRLHLPWDEFNRVPVAGVTNIARLSEMLDSAAVAFVVLTAEDEQADGTLHARMNVIHEVGLFQGRLGFTRSIVLLEEGCAEFSNIQGLGQIRFPEGNMLAAFEEIRRVLEREGLIE